MPSARRLCLLLTLGAPSCGDSAAGTSTAGTSTGTSTAGTSTAPTATGSGTSDPTTSGAPDPSTGFTGEPAATTTGAPDPSTGFTGGPDATTTGAPDPSTGFTGEPDTTTTGAPDPSTTTSGSSSSTGEPLCGPGSPGPDGDGDTVPDECDACPGGDDLVDGDGDGQADECDVCPGDDPDDSDADGVCEGVDACPGADDNIDGDDDGVPDACDELLLIGFPEPIDDYDVAGDGAMVVVRAADGELLVTCFNPDRSVRRPEFVAGSYEAGMNIVPPDPTIHIARDTQQVLVTWYDRNGSVADQRIAYSYLDDQCQAIVSNEAVIADKTTYLGFHDAAIDALGHAVVAVSLFVTTFNTIDDAGVAGVQVTALSIQWMYGTHVAVNQATGEGIVAAQTNNNEGIHYRRFNADGTFKPDGGGALYPTMYGHDTFTVGMNDLGEFVFVWRSSPTHLDMAFYDADGVHVADEQRQTTDFEDADYAAEDSFRRRHQVVSLRGDNFVLGEVYTTSALPQAITHHFEYTSDGALLAEDATTFNMEGGLTIRLDQVGFTYLRDEAGIHIRTDYP